MGKLFNLIKSGDKTNIELAFLLAEADGVYDKFLSALKTKYGLFVKEITVDFITELFSREVFDLKDKGLEILPDSIGDFKQMTALSLAHNSIKKLPETIGGLENLLELRLYNNPISELPNNISNLKKLKFLDLEHTLFSDIPIQVYDLPSLHMFDISGDKFDNTKENWDNVMALNIQKKPYFFITSVRLFT